MKTLPRRLALSEYRTLVGSLSRPTQLQMEQFAEYVSGAHSWYKHIPPYPPGVPIQFFLNPAAGMQLVNAKGIVSATPRVERGFHYSWLPTAEYRDRFGYLAFSRSGGTSISLLKHDRSRLVESDDEALVFDVDAQSAFHLPIEVLDSGRAFISGIVHTLGADFCLGRDWGGQIDWPAESGGSETVARIRDRCETLLEDQSRFERLKREDLQPGQDSNLLSVDQTLYQILEPERRRQKAGMVAAMRNVIDLVNAEH